MSPHATQQTESMKISSETLLILKNFATIETGILIPQGNVIQTKTKAVYASATVAESFPMEAGIYDLNHFLNAVSLFSDPTFEFSEECLRITEPDGRTQVLYGYAGAGMVQMTFKKKVLTTPTQTIDFSLSEEQLTKLQKAANIFQKPELMITSDGKQVQISTENHKQPSNTTYSLTVDAEPHGYACKMLFELTNLRLLKGSYDVTVTPNYTKFTNTATWSSPDIKLYYLIGAEPTTSTFGDAE